MDLVVFKVLRGAAIVLYLVALAMGGLMLFGLAGVTLEVGQGSVVDESSLLLAIAWAVLPAALGFSLDRLAAIGTNAGG